MLPVVEPSGLRTARLVVGFSLALVGVSCTDSDRHGGKALLFGNVVDWNPDADGSSDVCARTDRAQCQATVESFCSLSSVVAALHPFRRRVKVVRRVMSKISGDNSPVGHTLGVSREHLDPSLVPNMFAPESRPAHSIFTACDSRIGDYRRDVRASGWSAHLCHRSLPVPPNDDGTEPAQVYGSGPVEAAWTAVPILIVAVLTLDDGTGNSRRAGRPRASLRGGRAGHWASVVVGDPLSQGRHRHSQ